MLQFIYGRAATGKTYTVFERIKSDVENAEQVVLLVPEQFTFECERTLLHTLGDRSSTNVSVLSFTRLYDEICRKKGGRVADVITEFDRVLLIFRAISAVADNLKLWAKYKNSPRFAQIIADIITELKSSAISPDDLKNTIDKISEDYLKDKLEDLSLIYGAYNALLGNTFLDPADSLSRLNDNLLDYKYFENKTVYIDSFKNFTGQQYKILERIISQAKDVVCCFTADEIKADNNNLFYNVRNTAEKIIKIANKYGVEMGDNIKLETHHYTNEELAAVEKALLNIPSEKMEKESEFVTLCKCPTRYDEASFAASTIRRLVRTKGYRYKDFVIICRDAENYQKSVIRACEENGVFCFCDQRKSITYQPLTVFIDSLLSLSQSFSTQNILDLLKTGFVLENSEELMQLNNYIYLWNISGAAWRSEWDMNPREFGEIKDRYRKAAEQTIIGVNRSRRRAIEVADEFLTHFKGSPSDMVKAILKTLKTCKVADKLKVYTNNLTCHGLLSQADDARQSWDIIMQIFDGIVKCLPDKEITAKEFIDAWKLAVDFATIGNIPQMLDEVTFGSADRIKPSRPKVAFILGLNQNEFPKVIVSNGIFADSEREKLIEGGLEINSNGFETVIDEDYLAYTSLCCATERLYLSYSASDNSGKSIEPSSIVDTLLGGALNICVLDFADLKLEDSIPETLRSAEARMCADFGKNNNNSKTIEYALKDFSDISIDNYLSTFDKRLSSISDETAKKLFGKEVSMSATQFDVYHKCRFSYFCKYGLGLKSIQPATFNVLQRGLIVHYAMQRIIEDYGDVIGTLSRDKTDELVDGYIDEYLQNIPGYKNIETERLKFIVNKISLIAKDVVFHIVCEFAQSSFTPKYCELEIGEKKTIESAPISVTDDVEFSIIGSVDRVDLWNGYLRVVDYKTGTKIFQLPDILLGLNMQMLIYLYSIIHSKNKELNSLTPAGVLYMPSKRDKDGAALTMNGIIVEDEDIVRAMDKDNSGEYIPKLEYTKKEKKLKNNSFVSPEMFNGIFDYIEKLLKNMGENLYAGKIGATPTDGLGSDACAYCDYYSICNIEDKPHVKSEKMQNADVLLKIKEV